MKWLKIVGLVLAAVAVLVLGWKLANRAGLVSHPADRTGRGHF